MISSFPGAKDHWYRHARMWYAHSSPIVFQIDHTYLFLFFHFFAISLITYSLFNFWIIRYCNFIYRLFISPEYIANRSQVDNNSASIINWFEQSSMNIFCTLFPFSFFESSNAAKSPRHTGWPAGRERTEPLQPRDRADRIWPARHCTKTKFPPSNRRDSGDR